MTKYPINKEKLENLLIKKWTEFIDPRKILDFLGHHKYTPNKVKVTRFEFVKSGFIVWINYTSENEEFTSEFLVNNKEFIHIKTI